MQAIEQLVREIYGLGVVRREISKHALAELGSQGFNALAAIWKAGPMRVSDVAQALGVDMSVASRQVGALITAGYVDRQADPADRRAYRLTATERGTTVLRDSHRRMVDAFARPLASWPEEDIVALAAALDRLREDFAVTDPNQLETRTA
jgi:DNA-binding MarR family transcriptional regulator